MSRYRDFFLCGIAIVALSIAGCARTPTLPPEAVPFEVPSRFTAIEEATPAGGALSVFWWGLIDLPELSELVGEALANQPSLAAARARLEQAAAFVSIADGAGLPQLSAGFAAGRQRLRTGGQLFVPADIRPYNHELSLDLSWEIDLWGRVATDERAAELDLDAAVASYDGAILSLTGQVVRGYLLLTQAEQSLEIARSSEQAIASITGRVRERYLEGLRSALALRLTETDLANAESSRAAAERRLDAARRQLEILLGRYPAGQITVSAPLPEVPPIPEAIPGELLSRRPDLIEARRRLDASDLRHQIAEIDLLPRIVFGASAGTSAEQFKDLFDSDFGFWNFLGNVSAPLFQGGRLRAEVRRALAARDESLANYFGVVLTAYREVEELLAADRLLRQQGSALARAVTESQAALEISEERYFSGILDILDLLDARRRYFLAQDLLVLNQLERHTNFVNLVLALGGGYDYREDTEESSHEE